MTTAVWIFAALCTYGMAACVAMWLWLDVDDTAEWWAFYAIAWPVSPLLYLLRRTVWKKDPL